MENDEPIEVKNARLYIAEASKYNAGFYLKRFEDLLSIYEQTIKLHESKVKDYEERVNICKRLSEERRLMISQMSKELYKYKTAAHKAIEEKYPMLTVCTNCDSFVRGPGVIEHKKDCPWGKEIMPENLFKACSSYRSLFWNGSCSNCGKPKQEHN